MIDIRTPNLNNLSKSAPGNIAIRSIEALAATLMGVIIVLVLANALGRYLFAKPLPWSEEVVMVAMIWVASVGILLGTLRGSLICCDVLVMRLSTRVRRISGIICGILGGFALGFFAWQIWGYIGLFGSDLSPILRMPKGLGISALLVSMTGMAAILLFRAMQIAIGGRSK